MDTRESERILWSVEPFPRELGHLHLMAKALRLFADAAGFAIKPFSVVSPADLNWPRDLPGKSKDLLLNAARANILSFLRQLGPLSLEEPEIVFQAHRSTRHAAKLAADYSSARNVGMVAVSTHARPGLERWVLGSFMEALVGEARTPLLTVNPRSSVGMKFSRVLFVTDFTEDSHHAFVKCLAVARALKAELVIVHQLIVPIALPAAPGFTPDSSFDLLVAQELERADKDAKMEAARTWVKEAEEFGLRANYTIHDSGGRFVDAVFETSRSSRADLIAIGSLPVASAIGLVSTNPRSLARESPLPVLVIPMEEGAHP